MMTWSNGNSFHFPLYWPFVQGIHRSPVNSPRKASAAELWCFLRSAPGINGWVNNGEAGDLRRHRANYDVTVMIEAFHRKTCKSRYIEPFTLVSTRFLKGAITLRFSSSDKVDLIQHIGRAPHSYETKGKVNIMLQNFHNWILRANDIFMRITDVTGGVLWLTKLITEDCIWRPCQKYSSPIGTKNDAFIREVRHLIHINDAIDNHTLYFCQYDVCGRGILGERRLRVEPTVWERDLPEVSIIYKTLSQYQNGLSKYGYFRSADKTVVIPSYLYDWNSYTGKTVTLYWDTQPNPTPGWNT